MEWPASPWECAAPESYLLLHFKKHQAKQALKLGVLELIARRQLELVEVLRPRMFGTPKRDSLLVWGPRPKRSTMPLDTLEPLMEVLGEQAGVMYALAEVRADADSATGVLVSDFARAVVRRFGSVNGYVSNVVRSALEARGWVHREPYRILGVFPAKRWALTPAGLAAQGDLLWRVQYGNRELGRLVDDDPSRAVAFVGLAGASILLMDDARPHLQRLRDRLESGYRSDVGASGDGGGIAHSPATTDTGAAADASGLSSVDLGALDLGALDSALGGLDLGALDSLDAAMDAVDAGVDSGADGGGGGGGGDGGGGGGD
jgi:hypothetical protein